MGKRQGASSATAAGLGGAPTNSFGFGARFVTQLQDSSAVDAGDAPGCSAGAASSSSATGLPQELNAELAQQLDKLTKKHSTTRLKALQALRTLLAGKDPDEVQVALGPWTYQYSRLALDNSRAVRAEAAHVTGAIAAALGRRLAPSLKSLFPVWWLARYDCYSDVTAATAAGLDAAFPGGKQTDALAFCREEVLQLLADRLGSTPHALGDPRREAVEELADRHARVLESCCAALAALLDAAQGPGPARAELASGAARLLVSTPFRKAALQSKTAHVRRSAYAAVAAASVRVPQALQAVVADLSPAVLGSLSDSDPGNQRALWDMLLAFSSALPSAWQHVNAHKAVLPRLWSSLRRGCFGAAQAAFPAVLPFISLVPRDLRSTTFFETLLESVWSGQRILPAADKCHAEACFVECLQFALKDLEDQEAPPGSAAPPLLATVLAATVLPDLCQGSQRAGELLASLVPRLGQPDLYVRQALGACGEYIAASLAEALAQQKGGVPWECLDAAVQRLAASVFSGHEELAGQTLVQPIVAAVLPSVRDFTAPPGASVLLAHLTDLHPEHALGPQQAGSQGNETAGGSGTPVHKSASFTVEALLRRCLDGEDIGPVLAASCYLLLSCLRQVDRPADRLADILCSLAQQGAEHQGPATAALLLECLFDQGSQGAWSTEGLRSKRLDALAVDLCAAEHLGAPRSAQLLRLLLLGCDSASLLSPAAQATVIAAMSEALAAEQPDSTAVAAAALATDAAFASSLSDAEGVPDLQLGLLVRLFGWVCQGPPPQHHSEGTASDENSDAASQPGGQDLDTSLELDPGAAAGLLARAGSGAWERSADCGRVLARASPEAQSAGVETMCHTLLENAPGSHEGALVMWSSAARRADAARLAFAVCAAARADVAQLLTSGLLGAGVNAEPEAVALQPYEPWHAAFLALLGRRLGYSQLLPATAGPAAGVLVRLLASILELAPAPQAVPHSGALLQFAASEPGRLRRCLDLCLGVAGGPPGGPRDLGMSALEVLLRFCVAEQPGGGAPQEMAEVAAEFFKQRVAPGGAIGQTAGAVAAACAMAPALRQSEDLLRLSGLPQLATSACDSTAAALAADGSAAAAAAELRLVLACFPYPPHLSSLEGAASAAALAEALQPADLVWYCRSDGGWDQAQVISADRSIDPASFGIRIGGSHRETEAARLLRRWPGEPEPPSVAVGTALPPSSTADERAALVRLAGQLVQRSKQHPDGGAEAGPEAETPAALQLGVRAVAYCSGGLSRAEWEGLLSMNSVALGQAAQALLGAARDVAAAMTAAATAIAGMEFSTPEVALNFFEGISNRGFLQQSPKCAAAVQELHAATRTAVAAALPVVDSLLLPSLQAYYQLSRLHTHARALPASAWGAFESSTLSAAMKAFMAAGCLIRMALAAAEPSSGLVGASFAPGLEAWDLLADVVTAALLSSKHQFLEGMLSELDQLCYVTGLDVVGAMLALALSDCAPASLQAAAYKGLLLHSRLHSALSTEGLAEDEMPEDTGARAADVLEQAGLRTELAAALLSGEGARLPAWALLMLHLSGLPHSSRARREIAQALRDADLVPAALSAIIPLLPLGAAAPAQTPGTAGSRDAVLPLSTQAGLASRLLSIGLPRGRAQDEVLASLLYHAVLLYLPASSRSWFCDLRDRATAVAVERYTAAHVSPSVLAAEFDAISQLAGTLGKFDNFAVRGTPAAREVVAAMTVEDGHVLELTVRLSSSMPLRAAEVECRQKVGVSEGRLRKWLLSISACLRMQNASVADAIQIWKDNVEKEFEGQEECLICYSIVQPSSGGLPRQACRTCRKRFHGRCLYKWFKSSGKSACPHCQSPW